jgi:hypothetical protein
MSSSLVVTSIQCTFIEKKVKIYEQQVFMKGAIVYLLQTGS